MQNITIIAVGKGSKDYLGTACDEYIKRLKPMCNLKIVEIPHENLPEKNLSRRQIAKALDKEGDRVLAAIPAKSYIIPLCVEGGQMSSENFARLLRQKAVEGYSDICFIIGSSHGLADKVKYKGNMKLSFSQMTFTHGMAKFIILEQVYRALSINTGGKYHK